jgi:mRNA-degrading endonuclease RelE of RelBE toxin-antitoxin system
MVNSGHKYSVVFTKKVRKSLSKIPQSIRDKFFFLAEQLAEQGPVAANWHNYSKLGQNEYHCHLGYSWVACWTNEKGTLTIEVYYVGSRENAPY